MFSIFAAARKPVAATLLAFALTALAACEGGFGTGPFINTSRPVPVALLVPAGSDSPGDAVLAQSLENAARLAMADLDGVSIDLRVYATAGRGETAAEAARRAVADGAGIILGPVYAASANAAGRAVAAAGVNVLAFSNNPAIAGGNVYVLGPTFDNSADRLVSYAIRRGITSFHIVYGLDAAETSGRDAISAAIARNGGDLAGQTSFALTRGDVVAAVPLIAEEVAASGAEAVFLTSGNSGALGFLASLLPEAGLDPAEVRFMGLQRWDIPAGAVASNKLDGGWFARPDPGLATLFADRYAATYGSLPHPIAGLAYDGIAAIGALVAQGGGDALSGASLTQAAGFAGVSGVFRLLPDGTNERGLTVSQIIDGQVTVLDPAPRSFGIAGF